MTSRPRFDCHPWRLAFIVVITLVLSGCETLGYYSQAVAGQWRIIWQRQAINRLLEDDAVTPELKQQLRYVQAVREFASSELSLPRNGSYQYYSDTGRPFAVWNVVATEAFSVEPKRWCFPVAGCVSYRGYFSEQAARRFADQLAAEGYDTYVGGVSAYSTLGWFDDPVLNTFLAYPPLPLAGLVFHELAHQQLYLPGDTAFNEGFARAVEIAGVKAWLTSDALTALSLELIPSLKLEDYLNRLQRDRVFIDQMLEGRDALAELYQQGLGAEAMAQQKRHIITAIQQRYDQTVVNQWQGDSPYQQWVHQQGAHRQLNNAKLASLSSYDQWLPAFQQLLSEEQFDMQRFFQRVADLALLPAAEREAQLQRLMPGE